MFYKFLSKWVWGLEYDQSISYFVYMKSRICNLKVRIRFCFYYKIKSTLLLVVHMRLHNLISVYLLGLKYVCGGVHLPLHQVAPWNEYWQYPYLRKNQINMAEICIILAFYWSLYLSGDFNAFQILFYSTIQMTISAMTLKSFNIPLATRRCLSDSLQKGFTETHQGNIISQRFFCYEHQNLLSCGQDLTVSLVPASLSNYEWSFAILTLYFFLHVFLILIYLHVFEGIANFQRDIYLSLILAIHSI